MQEENLPQQPLVDQPSNSKPTEPPKKRDFLAPALVFIALFFSFFVLITMQRLSNKYSGKQALEEAIKTMETPTAVATTPDVKETTPIQEIPLEEQIMQDDAKTPDTVGDDLVKDIDAINDEALEDTLSPSSLDELGL